MVPAVVTGRKQHSVQDRLSQIRRSQLWSGWTKRDSHVPASAPQHHLEAWAHKRRGLGTQEKSCSSRRRTSHVMHLQTIYEIRGNSVREDDRQLKGDQKTRGQSSYALPDAKPRNTVVLIVPVLSPGPRMCCSSSQNHRSRSSRALLHVCCRRFCGTERSS